MKKFAFLFLFLFAPVAYSATENEITKPKSLILNNTFEKLGNEMKLNCKDVGEESCFSRFIAMSACTFAYGIAKSDKTVKESLDIENNELKNNELKLNLNNQSILEVNNELKSNNKTLQNNLDKVTDSKESLDKENKKLKDNYESTLKISKELKTWGAVSLPPKSISF